MHMLLQHWLIQRQIDCQLPHIETPELQPIGDEASGVNTQSTPCKLDVLPLAWSAGTHR
jgi:hypothetical protein